MLMGIWFFIYAIVFSFLSPAQAEAERADVECNTPRQQHEDHRGRARPTCDDTEYTRGGSRLPIRLIA